MRFAAASPFADTSASFVAGAGKTAIRKTPVHQKTFFFRNTIYKKNSAAFAYPAFTLCLDLTGLKAFAAGVLQTISLTAAVSGGIVVFQY